ncbi:MAG: hypothetical protein SGPRY_006208 [Prymnesium sp.]
MAALLGLSCVASLFRVRTPPLPSGALLEVFEGVQLLHSQQTHPTTTLDDRHDEFADLLSVGGCMWPCAPALCRWLAHEAEEGDWIRGARVLELGAGTGAVGLFCAGLGSRQVLLTDARQGLLPLQEANARRNAAQLAEGSEVSSQRLRWGSDAAPRGPWELVVGSDLTYTEEKEEMAALTATLSELLSRGGSHPRVVLAHDHRGRRSRRGRVSSWDEGDSNLKTFIDEATKRGLTIEQLRWEGASPEEQTEGCHEVSIIEVRQQ